MATVKFRLRKNSISLYVSLGRGRTYERRTGLTITPDNWSDKTGMPKQTIAPNKKLGSQLKDLKQTIEEQLSDAQATGEAINGDWLQNEIDIFFGKKSRTGHSNLVTYWIQYIIDNATTLNKGKGLSTSRLHQYKQLKDKIQGFQPDLKVKDVNIELGNKFRRYLSNEKGYGLSYVNKIISNLKAVCYMAAKYGIEASHQLRSVESSKPKPKYIIYLSTAELEKIANADIPQPHLQNARKWLLMGCYIGQRGSDLLNITADSIKEDHIELVQQKTGKKVLIPILPQVREIIESGLPHKISIQKLTNYFQDVCKAAEIVQPTKGSKKDPDTNRKVEGTYPKYELIGTHTCRRSFCSNFYGKLPTPAIMEVTGHTREKTFLAYIGKTGSEYLDTVWRPFIASLDK